MHVASAILAAGLTPATLLLARSSIRRQRLRAVDELTDLLYNGPETAGKRKAAEGDVPAGELLPQLEFVRAKYDPDATTGLTRRATDSKAGDGPDPTGKRRDRAYPKLAFHISAVVFWLVSAVGFWFILPPVCMPEVCPAPVAFLGTSTPTSANAAQAMIACAAFVGGFIGAALYLSRRVLNFELHTLAFARATISIMLGVLIAMIAYKSLNGGATFVAGAFNRDLADAAPGFWLGLAFFIGLAPEAGLSLVARRLNLRLRKELDEAALARAMVTPTEAIDGIDSEIAYRLQESGIYDVQNLATYNPLQLYVESPFGLMQCFDWILQAQLCLVCGQSRFFALKEAKIRTAFDLERAVLALGVDDNYVVTIGKLIFTSGHLETLLKSDALPLKTRAGMVRHGVAVMTDDLHVHRLRSVWTRLRYALRGGEQEWLYLTAPLPGEAGFPAKA